MIRTNYLVLTYVGLTKCTRSYDIVVPDFNVWDTTNPILTASTILTYNTHTYP